MKSSLRALNMVESAGIGATATFMPLFANSLTNSYILVGAIVAGYGLAQALSYAYFGKIYDRKEAFSNGSRLSLIRLGYLLSSAAFFLHIVAFDGLSLFGIRLLAGVATGIYAGALIAKSYETTTNGGKFTLAGIISFGSLGWFGGTMGAGMLKEMFGGDTNVVFAFSGLMFFAGFLISLKMGRKKDASGGPGLEAQKKVVPASTHAATAAAATSSAATTAAKDPCATLHTNNNILTTIQLLKQNKIVYGSFFLRQLGASAVWSMFPIFLAHELGASDFWVGAIYAANAITQFVFMNKYGHAMQSNYYRSIELGALLSAAVFIGYFLSQSYFHIFPIQIILGLSWSLLYIGSLLYLLDKNNEKATSSALLESAISIAAIIGPMAGGFIAEVSGIRNVLVFAFLITLGSFAMSRTLARQTVTVKKVQN